MREEHWYNADAAVDAGLADRTADADDQGDEDAPEDAREAAASWNLHIYGAAGPQPAVAAAARTWAQATAPTAELVVHKHATLVPRTATEQQDGGHGDVFAEVDDEQMASLGEVLAGLFDPTSGYDPQALGALIGDVYADAAAPPDLPKRPPEPPTSISIDELVDAIQEGVRP
jgi:hypothetical protein